MQKTDRTETTKNTTSRDAVKNTKIKDSGAKLIFRDPVLCAQFLRGYTDIELLKDVQPEDIEDITEQFLPLLQEARDSDSVKKIHLKGNSDIDTLYVIALIEHQTKVDFDMSFRILRYIVYILRDYASEMEKIHEGITSTKAFRYPPVLPIVFYDGTERWTASLDFKDRTALSDLLGMHIPSFQYIVVPLSEFSNQELIDKQDELSLIMLIDKLRSSAEFHKLKEIPEEYLDNISQNSPESLLKLISKIIAAFLHRLNVPQDEIGEFTDQIERRDFTMLFENFEAYDVQAERKKARELGMAEGLAEGRATGLAEGRAEGRAEGHAEGRATGLAEGRAAGLLAGRSESILDVLEDLGPVSSEIREQILSEKNLDTLKIWNKGAAKVESVDEFVEKFLKGRWTSGSDDDSSHF